jgi:hypothetical protein
MSFQEQIIQTVLLHKLETAKLMWERRELNRWDYETMVNQAQQDALNQALHVTPLGNAMREG